MERDKGRVGDRILRSLMRGRPADGTSSESTAKRVVKKEPVVRKKTTAEKRSTSKKPEAKKNASKPVEKSQTPRKETTRAKKTPIIAEQASPTNRSRRIPIRQKIGVGIGAGLIAVGGSILFIGNAFKSNGADVSASTSSTSQPLSTTTEGTTTTTAPTTTTTAGAVTTTTEGQSEGFKPSAEAEAFVAAWPKTSEEAAQRFGGYPSQWALNPEWIGKTIDNVNLGVFGFPNIEWRPVDLRNLPFNWPTTAEEAVEYFFPGQKIDPISMQPSWLIDPDTGEPTEDIEKGVAIGWHLDEDHAIHDESETNVPVTLHPGETAEGYFVNNTLIASDDRNFVLYGGFIGQELPDFGDVKGQGWTIWIPGVNPDAVALRMTLFNGPNNNVPHYSGPDGQQLGPDAYGFPPAYPAPAQENNG